MTKRPQSPDQKSPERQAEIETTHGTRWLLRPQPRRGGNLTLVIGRKPGVKLSPAIEEALNRTAKALQDEELQLAGACDILINCNPLECPELIICGLSQNEQHCPPICPDNII